MIAGDPVTDWIGAVAAVAAVVVALAAAFFAYRAYKVADGQLKATLKQVEQAAAQDEQESYDRNRPIVIAEIVPSIGATGIWDLRVSNLGGAYARNVAIDFVEGGVVDESTELAQLLTAFLQSRFDLAPGASLRVYWHFSPNGTERIGHADSLTEVRGVIAVDYEWDRGEGTPERFREEVRYDTDELGLITPAPGLGPRANRVARTPEEEQVKVLMNLDHALRNLSFHLGEIRR